MSKTIITWIAQYALILVAFAQSDPRRERYDQIMENSALLDVTLQANRATYLPGEAATFTLSIKNNTSQRLEILAPFSKKQSLTPYKINAVGERIALVPTPSYAPIAEDAGGETLLFVPNLKIQTVHINPGEEIRVSVDSFGIAPIGSDNQVATTPGMYEVVYQYGWSGKNVTAGYRVIDAELGSNSLAVKMPKNSSMDSDMPGETGKVTVFTYRLAFELQSEGTTHLCVSPVDMRLLRNAPPARVRLTPGRTISTFVRVAESPIGFKDLTFAVRPNEDLVLTWKDAQQQLQTLTLDKDARKKQ